MDMLNYCGQCTPAGQAVKGIKVVSSHLLWDICANYKSKFRGFYCAKSQYRSRKATRTGLGDSTVGFRKSKQDLNNACCGSILRNPKCRSGATRCSYKEFEAIMKSGTDWGKASLVCGDGLRDAVTRS
ncbi:hypothetical protein Tco_0966628 [Tanacetum coccineum]